MISAKFSATISANFDCRITLVSAKCLLIRTFSLSLTFLPKVPPSFPLNCPPHFRKTLYQFRIVLPSSELAESHLSHRDEVSLYSEAIELQQFGLGDA